LDSNEQTLDFLFETHQINLRRGSIFDVSPGPMPKNLDFGRVEGMMLGLAIGDALGCTSESQLPADRRTRYGEIRDYLPNRVGAAVGALHGKEKIPEKGDLSH
jgi:hypothetical protein